MDKDKFCRKGKIINISDNKDLRRGKKNNKDWECEVFPFSSDPCTPSEISDPKLPVDPHPNDEEDNYQVHAPHPPIVGKVLFLFNPANDN